MIWRLGVATLLLAAMTFTVLLGADRSVNVANRLVEKRLLRTLDDAEEIALHSFLAAVLESLEINKSVSINQRYKKGSLNLYIVKAADTNTTPGVTRGNAAYVASSDIIFIESSYFDFGSHAVFARSNDNLTEKVISPLRVHAFFVLAHELAHRQIHGGWFEFSRMLENPQREVEADEFAIKVLKELYATDESRKASGVPEPTSELIGVEGDVTPLQRIADHLGYSISYVSQDIFESPFPILTASGTHPAFFTRMNALLESLVAEAEAEKDEDALRQLRVVRSVIATTNYLISLHPSEIEFTEPFQYAYLDSDILYVVGSDRTPVSTIPLKSLKPGRQSRHELPPAQAMATVRYAWEGRKEETLILRRDGRLAIVKTETGATVSEQSIGDQFGDNSCVKQLILPPRPNPNAYVVFCRSGEPYVAIVNREGTILPRPLKDLLPSLATDSATHEEKTAQIFDLDAAGHPAVIYVDGEAVRRLSLSDDLVAKSTIPLTLRPDDLPPPATFGAAKGILKPTVSDSAGRSYYLVGSPLFRNISLYDAERPSDVPFASVASSGVKDDRFLQPLWVSSSYYINNNRLIINLVEGGAYLLNFNNKTLQPLRENGFGAMEQIVSNEKGNWIYYRKYDRRILFFREEN